MAVGVVLEADFAAYVGQLMFGQHAGDDAGHGQAQEDAPVGAQRVNQAGWVAVR